MKVLEAAVGAIFAPTRLFSLVRISTQDLVADGKSLVRSSGVGGGGENLILTYGNASRDIEKLKSQLENLRPKMEQLVSEPGYKFISPMDLTPRR